MESEREGKRRVMEKRRNRQFMMRKSTKVVSQLRVISGRYRGTSLRSPLHASTHPMGAREKLALFNMVNVEGARVLDAYAGSGALGIEALSRGAREVVFVEANRAVGKVLQENLDKIGVNNFGGEAVSNGAMLAMNGDDLVSNRELARTAFDKDGAHMTDSDGMKASVLIDKVGDFADNMNYQEYFDVILADPPYDGVEIGEVGKLVKLLRLGGILALSSPADLGEIELEGVRISSTHTYARARITVYRKD